jgi:hypothetical protein
MQDLIAHILSFSDDIIFGDPGTNGSKKGERP